MGYTHHKIDPTFDPKKRFKCRQTGAINREHGRRQIPDFTEQLGTSRHRLRQKFWQSLVRQLLVD
jgi:hypothetical protein